MRQYANVITAYAIMIVTYHFSGNFSIMEHSLGNIKFLFNFCCNDYGG